MTKMYANDFSTCWKKSEPEKASRYHTISLVRQRSILSMQQQQQIYENKNNVNQKIRSIESVECACQMIIYTLYTHTKRKALKKEKMDLCTIFEPLTTMQNVYILIRISWISSSPFFSVCCWHSCHLVVFPSFFALFL